MYNFSDLNLIYQFSIHPLFATLGAMDLLSALHFTILLGLSILIMNYLLNLKVFRFPRITQVATPAPLLSVLIPARNEEFRLSPCLDTLGASDYPNFEILVLNDHSQDETGKLIDRHALGDPRIRHLTGQDLPKGWTGKAWACHQLAQAARGDLLLFLDADTRLSDTALSSTVNIALQREADLLSLWPEQETETWSEILVIPFVHLFILLYLPHWISGSHRDLGAANGQFMLFRKDAYQKIGGHASVRGHMVEDIALGRRVRQLGLRLLNLDGFGPGRSEALVRCRMYTRFHEVWEGFTKNLYPSFDGRWLAFLFFQFLQVLIFLTPFLLWVTGHGSPLVGVEIGIIFCLRLSMAHRFRQRYLGALLHPFGQLLVLAIATNSLIQTLRRRLPWKGRHYAHT
ncbi:MAG: glycosyltransferase [Verrucomicrobia bacterium]|nr:glycosyltransferase [Verrucomicrobiota bacterium]